MPYATVNDVEARLGRTLTTSENTQATAWLADIESDILQRIPDLAARISAGEVSNSTVVRVEAAAVRRVLLNPDIVRQRQYSIDDYSESATLDNTISGGLLYLTDDEWNLLMPGASGDAFTIRPYGTPGFAF